jgi:hypothetical protein
MLRKTSLIRRLFLVVVMLLVTFTLSNSPTSITKAKCNTNSCIGDCQQAFLECLDSGEDEHFCRDARTVCVFACP